MKASNLKAQIDKSEVEFAVKEQITKLEQAFVQGVLNEEEYESKVDKVHKTIEAQIARRKQEEKNLGYMIKLKQALESGILTRQEYEAKVINIQASIL